MTTQNLAKKVYYTIRGITSYHHYTFMSKNRGDNAAIKWFHFQSDHTSPAIMHTFPVRLTLSYTFANLTFTKREFT